jgi:hypothetical protein
MGKRSSHALLLIIVLPICVLILQACYNKNNAGMLVSVISVSPNHGMTGTLVTITGTGFISDTSQETVAMGFIKAPIIAVNSTQIVVSVPLNKDSAKLDSVPILVSVQAAVVGAGEFTYDNLNVGANDVTTFAGSGASGSADGTGTAASFNYPENGAFDKNGNLFVADYGNNEIREVSPSGVVTTFAGSTTAGYQDGLGKHALFHSPSGLCFDTQGNLYVSDELNNRIRKIDQSGNVTTVAGNGNVGYYYASTSALSTPLDRPIGIAYDSISGMLIVADSRNNVIRAIHLSDMTIATLAGPNDGPNHSGSKDETSGDATLTGATFNSPRGIAIYATGSPDNEQLYVYVADYGNNKIREILSVGSLYNNLFVFGATGATANVNTYTLAGNSNNMPGFTNGNGAAATFSGPNSLCQGYYPLASGAAQVIFIGDASNNAVRYVTSAEGSTSGAGMDFETVAGTGLPGLTNGIYSKAQFTFPDGVAYNPLDGNLYIIEYGNNDIRKILLH